MLQATSRAHSQAAACLVARQSSLRLRPTRQLSTSAHRRTPGQSLDAWSFEHRHPVDRTAPDCFDPCLDVPDDERVSDPAAGHEDESSAPSSSSQTPPTDPPSPPVDLPATESPVAGPSRLAASRDSTSTHVSSSHSLAWLPSSGVPFFRRGRPSSQTRPNHRLVLPACSHSLPHRPLQLQMPVQARVLRGRGRVGD